MRLSIRRLASHPIARLVSFVSHQTWHWSWRGAVGLKRYLGTDSGRTMLLGTLGGLYLLSFLHRFWATLGTSLPMVVGVGVAVALGVEFALLRPFEGQLGTFGRRFGMPFALFVLTAWLLAFDAMTGAAISVAGQISAASLARFHIGVAFGCGTAICLLTLPICLLSKLPALRQHDLQNNAAPYLSGVALGLIVGTLIVAPIIGVQFMGLAAAIVAGAIIFAGLLKSRNVLPSNGVSIDATAPAGLAAATSGLWSILVVATLGALLATGSRLLDQVVPSGGYLVYGEWAALFIGLGIGLKFAQSRRDATVERAARSGACLAVAAVAIALLACDSILIDGLLYANAHIATVPVMMLLRLGVASLMFLPIGFGWGAVAGSRCRVPGASQTEDSLTADDRNSTFRISPSPLAFVAGFVMVRFFAISITPLAWLVIGASWALVLLAFVNWIPVRQTPTRSWMRASAAVAIGLVAVAPLFREMGQGDLAAKLLFATNVFGAKLNNVNSRFLPVLDEGRLIGNVPGSRGTFTVWKYRGMQLIVRESGVPKAVISTQPEICPEYSPEKMHTILPLVLHEQPHNVLLLGLGGGDGLVTCLSFPVVSVTGVEDDGGLMKVLSDVVWPECHVDPLSDNRLRLRQVDPALALADSREKYDVIISRPDQSALWQSTPYYTLEFYRHAAARLERGGMFCQRFQQIDLGPEPMQVLAHTMQRAFSQVVAIETGMGEIVMLGTNSPEGIVHKNFKENLQRAHVRKALAQMGWDWTVPLNCIAFQNESLSELAEQAGGHANTAANGRFAFTLPQEVMRWGDKMRQQREVLFPKSIAMLAWPGCEFSDPEVLWRLSEVVGLHNLMTKFPDQQWAYRKALRERMEKDKSSMVNQIQKRANKEGLHPQDEQRKAYLLALASAVTKPAPSREEIEKVGSFIEPFDPILSYFIHHELAELLKRSAERDPHEELVHRLHLAYFADGSDQSVRNVASAMELLATDDQTEFDPVARFDQLNALLQMMKLRWETKGIGKPKSVQYTLNDVNKSVTAIERSFAEMDKLAEELNLPGIDWKSRQAYLESTLVRPLRTYRTELTALHERQKARTDAVISKSQEKDKENEDRTADLLPSILGN